MGDLVKYLLENRVQILSRIGRDKKVKSSPFMFILEHDKKLWYCTNNTKEIYKDLQNDPNLELTIFSKDYSSWIRIEAQAVFENNKEVKIRTLEENKGILEIYKSWDNPIFEVFYLSNVHAVIGNFAGKIIKEFNL
ncbi:pyridoxamine 5'-phosphate oxidase family protein [Mycoplasma struthionis]|uniref:Pyridoxamine 5'-phosphate oxidase n=1 Tax=Mycoplasma struthionis TaxID=538220 RepID=A0A3G8LH99_9MOLU|nr:pyridoxamine 5'-phosphate oxidase family protein [Mycoplasma struthionis]AZG68724.1 pyridoxamine 5'-phosphate oxidase [Mycoplasma struthionis]